MSTRLEFLDLVGGYGETTVIRGLSGRVGQGSTLCVLGRNGVGKTTLLKTLLGSLRVQSGDVRLDGRSIAALDPVTHRRLGMSYCPQERPVFDSLSVQDNLTLMSDNRDVDRFEPYFSRFPILGERLRQPAGTLSGGEKKLLAFTRTLAEDQSIILLDEPSEGVQWENILHMADLVKEHRMRGASFVIVEQNLAFAELVADEYLVMDQGRTVLSGARSNVSRTDITQHLHL
jgi:urea transport system ATP-binding protein